MNDDSSSLLQAQWNRFNDAFKQPDSDDAQRIAAQVRESMNSWITTSLNQLQQNMTVNLSTTVDTLNANLKQTVTAFETAKSALDTQIKTFQTVLDASAMDPNKKKDLTDAITALQGTVQKSLDAWKDAGVKAVTGVNSIVSNVIGLAAKV